MLQASILGLGVATLAAALSAIDGARPIVLPPAHPGPVVMALGGELLETAAEAGPGCFAPMLDELRRHPRWSIRIDDLVWDDVEDGRPDERRASLVIDAASGVWRDGQLPQSLSLAEDERRAVLAAFALDCRTDPDVQYPGFEGRYIGVALGEDGVMVARFPTNSPVALRLDELFDQLRARYLAGRAADLRGFSLELDGTIHDHDDQDRTFRKPHRIVLRERDFAEHHRLEDQIGLLDWLMRQPATLPASIHTAHGTLRVMGAVRPIAIDLEARAEISTYAAAFDELMTWAAVNVHRED